MPCAKAGGKVDAKRMVAANETSARRGKERLVTVREWEARRRPTAVAFSETAEHCTRARVRSPARKFFSRVHSARATVMLTETTSQMKGGIVFISKSCNSLELSKSWTNCKSFLIRSERLPKLAKLRNEGFVLPGRRREQRCRAQSPPLVSHNYLPNEIPSANVTCQSRSRPGGNGVRR